MLLIKQANLSTRVNNVTQCRDEMCHRKKDKPAQRIRCVSIKQITLDKRKPDDYNKVCSTLKATYLTSFRRMVALVEKLVFYGLKRGQML